MISVFLCASGALFSPDQALTTDYLPGCFRSQASEKSFFEFRVSFRFCSSFSCFLVSETCFSAFLAGLSNFLFKVCILFILLLKARELRLGKRCFLLLELDSSYFLGQKEANYKNNNAVDLLKPRDSGFSDQENSVMSATIDSCETSTRQWS